MKKTFAALALLATLFLAVSACAMTVEAVDPIRVSNGLVVTDYGFAAANSQGYIQQSFGHVLEQDEQSLMEIMGWQPCFYCKILNDTDQQQTARLYIRSARKSSVYWNKKVPIAAHEEYTFFGGGSRKDKPSKYSGAYSVDFTGKKADVVRFELFIE